MRIATLLLALAVGCNAAALNTADPALDAVIACEAAKAIVRARKPAPPAPKPVTPAGVCERCQGTGYIGDKSSVRAVCPECGGTGKASRPVPGKAMPAAEATAPASRPAEATTPASRPASCANGKCTVPR